ncbi:FISUMP domain-containing protein [Fibrobacter sp.]|uniref:FISUMP domain-containing protein n=1 Tax=Fibrobacter sp. TaxID=35828 RepID=UPI00388CF74A
MNSDTKDTVVAEIDDEQMVVVEVREYESDFDEDEGSSGGSSGSKGSRSSSSYHYDDGDGEESKLSSSPMNIYKSGSSTTSIIGKNSDAFLNPSITYGTLVDERDGQVYKTVKIGIQNWMAQNLNFYLDTSWESIYAVGRLYRWTDAMNMPSKYLTNDACEELNSIHPQGICPDGWHVPTKGDWGKLFAYARMNGVKNLGVALRAKENEAWPSKLTPATDDFGFSVAYGNYQSCDYQCRYLYNYDWISYGDSVTVFWTAECGGFFLHDDAYTVNVYADSVQIRKLSKLYAAYVRCIEDYDIDSLAQPAPVAERVYDSVKHTLTDLRNNRVYKTAQVGDQVWMAENLDQFDLILVKATEPETSSSSGTTPETSASGDVHPGSSTTALPWNMAQAQVREANGILHFVGFDHAAIVKTQVFSLYGRCVKTSFGVDELNLRDLPAGAYLVKVSAPNFNHQFVVQNR